jgi:hypothetical protein
VVRTLVRFCAGARFLLTRARRSALASPYRDRSGEVVAFPYKPRTADLPRGWRHWSPAEKIEHLLGISLDRAHEILSWRVGELDSHRLNVLTQVLRVILMIGVRALLDGTLGREAARDRDRHRALEELTLREFGTDNEA